MNIEISSGSKVSHNHPDQRGSVLVVGMILLVILMVGAVSMMNSSVQDEKISGNTKRASDAFLAAEAGIEHTIAELCRAYDGVGNQCIKHEADDAPVNPPNWYYYNSCGSDGELEDVDENSFSLADKEGFGTGSKFTVTYGGDCEEYSKPEEGVRNVSFRSVGHQAGETAERVLRFNLSHDGEATWPAVFVNDDPNANSVNCDFYFGPSSAYKYDGKGGPAISTNTNECADQIRESDLDKDGDPSGKLVGGVIANNPAPDFTNPNLGLKPFYKALLEDSDTVNIYPVKPNNKTQVGQPVNFNDSKFNHWDFGTPGDPADPTDHGDMKSFIVHGDLTVPGGFSGAGVLVVTGNATFSGTPNWDGLIVVLGGRVEIGGGGTTNGLRGSMIVSKVDFNRSLDPGGDPNDPADYTSGSPQFKYCKDESGSVSCELKDPSYEVNKDSEFYANTPRVDTDWWHGGDPEVSWDVSGGGTARYNYGCEYLMQVDNFLNDNFSVDFPGPNGCPDPNADGQTGSFGTIKVVDWYEEVNN